MESVSSIAFSITGRPRVQAFAGGHIKQRDREANDGRKKKKNVGHRYLHFGTAHRSPKTSAGVRKCYLAGV
jgi:hypothetical protein